MTRYPIIQSPMLDDIEHRLRPCPTYCHGFLGEDERKLVQILTEDQGTVHALGLTHIGIAERLRSLTEAARGGWGDPELVDDKFFVEVHEIRGKLPCPWPHPGLYQKGFTRLENIKTGEKLVWTELSIHLIGEHGFYEGKGSPYRLDPKDLKRILEL